MLVARREAQILVEHDQSARVDRVEADVGAIGALQQRPEILFEILGRQAKAFALAGVEVAACRRIAPVVSLPSDRRQSAPARGTLPSIVRAKPIVAARKAPAFRQQDHELAFLADAFEMDDQILDRIERLALAAAIDQLLRDARGLHPTSG